MPAIFLFGRELERLLADALRRGFGGHAGAAQAVGERRQQPADEQEEQRLRDGRRVRRERLAAERRHDEGADHGASNGDRDSSLDAAVEDGDDDGGIEEGERRVRAERAERDREAERDEHGHDDDDDVAQPPRGTRRQQVGPLSWVSGVGQWSIVGRRPQARGAGLTSLARGARNVERARA